MSFSAPWKSNAASTAIDSFDFLKDEPADKYHAQAANYLSSHQLADFRRCPLLYRRKQLGLIGDFDRPAYLLGRAGHTLILEGQAAFDAQYEVGGPINPKTNNPYGANTKAFAEWAASTGKNVLTDEQYTIVAAMQQSVGAHEGAAQLLSEGRPEAVARTEYCDVPSQIRMDWFHPQRGIVDLKTCDDLTWFESDSRRFGYAHQLAFYRAVLAEFIGEMMPVHLIAVEKKEPFRCGVWQMSAEVLGIAQRENEDAIERLKYCQANDTWPTGYEDVRVFDAI